MTPELRFYTRLILRRLPIMAALFILCGGIGIALAIKLPTTYSATATLLVEAPQIPQNLAASTVRTSASEQLEVIRRRLMTRANLIDIANKFEVFGDDPDMSPDEIVAQMRAKTQMRSKGRPLVMTISFSSAKPRTTANVVNEYITLILDANVKLRTGQAEETLSFFEQEAERLDNELSIINERILEFQNANAGALPENLEYRLNRQSSLQERLARLERDKARQKEQRDRIVTAFEETGRVDQNNRNLSPEEKELQKLQGELENALVIYSANNPRVQLLQAKVDNLQAAIAASAGADAQGNDPQLTLYNVTLADIDAQLENIDIESAQIKTDLAALQASIEQTPKNGIALRSLQRDYTNIQSQYNAAVSRLATASMGERIELSSKGQRVTVVENASVPSQPTSPNRPMIAAAGIGGGLALAIGVFILLELLNSTLRRPVEVVKQLGVTPLSTIPYIESASRRRMRRTGQVLLTLAVLVGVPAGLWVIDTQYQPLEILTQRLLDMLPI